MECIFNTFHSVHHVHQHSDQLDGSRCLGFEPWVITSEDRAKYDAQFYQLQPIGGFITGKLLGLVFEFFTSVSVLTDLTLFLCILSNQSYFSYL